MKKVFGILLAVCLLLTSSVSLADGQKLVLITATASDNLDVLIPAFEAATGIDVELITASTGEVYSRIQNETNNPSADVTWISASYVSRDTSFFTPYVSVHNDELPEGFRTQDGYINYVNFTMPVLLVNKNLVDIEIKGYKDLLDPSLFGKIAHGDAAASSSAYNHIENMLVTLGDGDMSSEAGWEYVEAFLKQLDGKIINSSGTIYKGVEAGEYAVGLTWDTPCLAYLAQGIDYLDMVVMEEGALCSPSGVAVIKNCKNEESAKAFVDFMTSKEAQSLMGTKVPGANPIRTDVELASYKKGLADMNASVVDASFSAANKPAVLERYQDLYLEIFE
ncbi:MAG: extracellular solute-binding protein [Clostridia bacterium]|nr:extracellular solute-binding protein [Clostridia bacterium]